jgi:phage shock protein A
MWNAVKRRWRYLSAKLDSDLEARADPKVQLEQAIREVQDQHVRLREQAANVIARQKQTEMQLNRAMDELESVNHSTRQALALAEQAEAAGDAEKAAGYNQAAEAFANQLIAVEKRVEDLKTMSLQAAQASEQAKTAVQQNAARLNERLAERSKLLNQLEQAKMQEQLNAATVELDRTVGGDVPTLDQVRDKIEARYAKAVGAAELGNATVEARMLEVRQASLGAAARSRLDQIRREMAGGATAAGLGPAAVAPLRPAPPAPSELGAPNAASAPAATPEASPSTAAGADGDPRPGAAPGEQGGEDRDR